MRAAPSPLADLLEPGLALVTGDAALRISGIVADSRAATPGCLFVAIPGTRADGAAFVADAAARGAVAVLAAPGLTAPPGLAVIAAANPRRALSRLAARLSGAQPRTICAVTGTSGKTSVVAFARQIWTALGHRAASLGTLGVVAPGRVTAGALTTPDPVALHDALARLAEDGVDHVAMEASSHGLDQYRLDGVNLAAGAFTNLSRDHLDYHKDMAAYLAAKLRLFDSLLPAGAAAIVNADDPNHARIAAIAAARGLRLIDFGHDAAAIRLLARRVDGDGQILDLSVLGQHRTTRLPLVGAFQVANALAALGLVIGTGAGPGAAVDALAGLSGVPGRLQLAARRRNGAAIFVDYAHKPAALAALLATLRPSATGALAIVFGCGGERDAGKRPEMGAIAAAGADRVYVTDDNPRGEDPASIRAAILAACPGGIEIGARRAAIFQAVAALAPGDILVIAGKGHEAGQIIGGVVTPFDDVAVAIAAAQHADTDPRAGAAA
jgi:UDP-N-acetylmuramoyl-L-alanyl-D-glutamate--2,6-diaminopimelate ligase